MREEQRWMIGPHMLSSWSLVEALPKRGDQKRRDQDKKSRREEKRWQLCAHGWNCLSSLSGGRGIDEGSNSTEEGWALGGCEMWMIDDSSSGS